jgi:SAM-dependent methyltransferase
VTGDPEFRTDLYRGTAPFYDRFRPPYPDSLFDDLCARLPVSGNGRLLDLACGTGQIALPLARIFREVVAVDQEGESVAYGQTKAQSRATPNITWIEGTAEGVVLDGFFELIAVGNAFHRLNRRLVAERMFSWLQPRGGVALLWADTPWHGDRPWQRALADQFEGWMRRLKATDRVPPGWQEAIAREPHALILRRAGFVYVGRFEFPMNQTWDAPSLCGFAYSSSVLSLAVLGDKRQAFERDIERCLRGFESTGSVASTAVFGYELATRPG